MALGNHIANDFQTALNQLNFSLNTQEEFDAYYVCRRDSPINELIERIKMDNTPSKYLFTGLRACGKTTELKRLRFSLEDDFFVVFFSAMEDLSLVDIDYKDVLWSMIFQTLKTLKNNEVDVDEKILRDVEKLLKEISGELKISFEDVETTSFGFGAGLFAIVSEIMGKYKSEVITRKEIRKNSEHMIQEIIRVFNSLITEIYTKVGKSLLIIVDDLEKADLKLAEEIFYKHSFTLSQPICKVVFTIPLPLVYSPSWRHVQVNFMSPNYFLPVISVKNKNGENNLEGISYLKDIILKRMSDNLIENEALEKILMCSGGVVTDLLRLMMDCCVKTYARDIKKINIDVMLESFVHLVDDFWRPLETKYYDKLVEVANNKDTDNDKQLRFLLYMNAILEYKNNYRWYDVHPAVHRILKAKKLI